MAHFMENGGLPRQAPDHRQEAAFGEVSGRGIAPSGFLEAIPGKAIFAINGPKSYSEEEAQVTFLACDCHDLLLGAAISCQPAASGFRV